MLCRLGSKKLATTAGALSTPMRFIEYWGATVTGRTQPYAQGDMLPRLDNTKHVVDRATASGASLTGNQNNMAYDSTNIFSAVDYSGAEKAHYQPLRGVEKYVVDPLQEKEGPAAAALMQELMEPEVEASLEYLWWSRVLKDFPSLKKPMTPALKKAWQDFYIAALQVAHDDAAVTALARPFLREQIQQRFIGHAMVWRIAERLGDALEGAPKVSRYEQRASRMAVERVTKITLNTVADEPWSHQDNMDPLFFDVSNFRAWHEAKYW